jgi:phage terminase large subunit
MPDILKRVRINKAYHNLRDADERYMVIVGGRRSGKSVGISQLLVLRAGMHRRHIVVMRKVAETIRMSVWPRVLAAVEEAEGLRMARVNRTDRRIELANGSVIDFLGADDPQKLKSLEGITDVWMEEATEFDEIDLDTIDAGLSVPCTPPPQIWLTFNPIPMLSGVQHWIQRRFMAGGMPEPGQRRTAGWVTVMRTTYRDNAFCPQATRELLEGYQESNPSLYKLWALGEFTAIEGAILTGWDVVKTVPVGVELLGCGLDFGFADDPAAVLRAWRHNDEVWIKQLVYSTGLTNQALSAEMETAGVAKNEEWIVADSAEPKSIRELKELGWMVSASEKGPDYKRAAARYLQGLTIHVLEGSTDMVRELSTWTWERDKRAAKDGKERFLPVPRDGDDHLIDALIYRVARPDMHIRSAYGMVDGGGNGKEHNPGLWPGEEPKQKRTWMEESKRAGVIQRR